MESYHNDLIGLTILNAIEIFNTKIEAKKKLSMRALRHTIISTIIIKPFMQKPDYSRGCVHVIVHYSTANNGRTLQNPTTATIHSPNSLICLKPVRLTYCGLCWVFDRSAWWSHCIAVGDGKHEPSPFSMFSMSQCLDYWMSWRKERLIIDVMNLKRIPDDHIPNKDYNWCACKHFKSDS